MNPREEGVPTGLERQLEANGPNLNSLLKVMPYLPEAIKAMSDQFVILKNNKTPWDMDAGFEAYFYYFHVLNTVRMISVLKHLKSIIPDLDVDSAVDLGSGLGSVQMAFSEVFPNAKPDWTFIESHVKAKRWHQKVCDLKDAEWLSSLDSLQESPDLFFASYSLNEIDKLPKQALEAKHLVLLEPSNQFFSRKLMAMREPIMQAGFQIIAPCTHAESCPLLVHSKQDFCHDRIHFSPPKWFEKIEEKLPMKNRSLTFSYLVASKEVSISADNPLKARVIGDTLKEKGKTRQAICRNSEKEFLSWLKRYGKAPFLPHGSLIKLEVEPEKKGNELRNSKIKEFS